MKTAGFVVLGFRVGAQSHKILKLGKSSVGKWKAWNARTNQHLGPQCNAMILFIPDSKCNKDKLSKPPVD